MAVSGDRGGGRSVGGLLNLLMGYGERGLWQKRSGLTQDALGVSVAGLL